MCSEEQRVADELKEAGVLTEMSPELLTRTEAQYLVGCSDGHHAMSLVNMHALACGMSIEQIDRGRALFHPILVNGGCLCFSPTCALARLEGLPQDHVVIMNLAYAMLLKGTHGQVSLYSHSACGAAGLAQVHGHDVYDQALRGKYRLRRIFTKEIFDGSFGAFILLAERTLEVITRKPWHINKGKWVEWLQQPSQSARRDAWSNYKQDVESGLGLDVDLDVFRLMRKKMRELQAA